MNRNRILVVEDDDGTTRSLAAGLAAEGFEVRTVSNGGAADASLAAHPSESPADLVILDWMLPGIDGITLLRRLRARGQRMPVLLLTARDAIDDRVQGLEAGADDYLAKPFAFAELLARVRALLRRFTTPREPWQRSVADLAINLETRLVTRAGRSIDLTPREFDLLSYLSLHQGEAVSRDQLAREIWRENNRATPIDNVIDVHIARLRRKIDEASPGAEKLLHTLRGLGYMLRSSASSAVSSSASPRAPSETSANPEHESRTS
ncbi:DNA-binding response regulator [Opitutaceae bacterium TAV4]|nr:DNA-binding response regulator [Opitutaceae bacterium TAV4]